MCVERVTTRSAEREEDDCRGRARRGIAVGMAFRQRAREFAMCASEEVRQPGCSWISVVESMSTRARVSAKRSIAFNASFVEGAFEKGRSRGRE